MSLRLFIAIPIHPGELLLKQRAFLQSNLAEEQINWVKEENMHLTLKFLGKTSSKQIASIVEAASRCASKHLSFPMILERVGVFGSSYHAKVVWVGIRENQYLLELQRCLFQELEKIGFQIDRQNFVPHFTLGRIKKIQHKDHFKRVMELAGKGFIQETMVNGFVLFESVLTSEGPIYKIIKHFDLKDR